MGQTLYAVKRAPLFVPPTVDLQILVGVRFVDVVLVVWYVSLWVHDDLKL